MIFNFGDPLLEFIPCCGDRTIYAHIFPSVQGKTEKSHTIHPLLNHEMTYLNARAKTDNEDVRKRNVRSVKPLLTGDVEVIAVNDLEQQGQRLKQFL